MSISDAKHAVVHAQNDMCCLGPREICYSGPEVTVLRAKTTSGVLDTERLVIPVLKSLFFMHKTTGEGCKQYSLFILMLSTQLCVNPYRLVILMQITLFCMYKTTGYVWDP